MSINHWRQSFVAWIAPVLAVAISIGNTAAFAGHRSDCRSRVTPSQPCNCPCECTSSAPVAQPSFPSDAYIDPSQPLVNPEATVDSGLPPALTQPSVDSGFSSSFDDTDFSTGLATNFGGGGATSSAYAAPGYIEIAPIGTRVRVRYDNMQGANAPARAGFLYPTPRQLAGGFIGGPGIDYFDLAANEIDLQVLSTYAEFAFHDRFSIFVDVPIRWIGPYRDVGGIHEPNNGDQDRGVGDISAGFRWGLINCPDEHLTLQVRTTAPTGDPLRTLGTGNTTIDIALLYDQQINDRTWFYAELNDWQTLDAVTLIDTGAATDPSLLNQNANILRLGAGLGYDLLNWGTRCNQRKLTGLFECVLWTVLDGVDVPINATTTDDLVDARGDTIINGKYGVRYTHGNSSIYVGYGHNWTSDRCYSDLLRLEWMQNF